jgi:hypothetical protein
LADRSKVTLLLVMLIVTWLAAGPVQGQIRSRRGRAAPEDLGKPAQYVVTGKIERRDHRHVLIDDHGDLEAYLIPKASLDMERFVGQTVEMKVRQPLSRQDGKPRYWVDEVSNTSSSSTSPGKASVAFFDFRSERLVEPAQYHEPMVVPSPGVTETLVSEEDEAKTWGPQGWIWGSAEYLLWWSAGMDLPPLVSTSPLGTPRVAAGVLGEPSTEVIYGGDDILTGSRSGLRLRLGAWFDSMYQIGAQAEFFGLQDKSAKFEEFSDSAGHPILARPFFNINPRVPVTNIFDPPAREDAQLISFPNELSGMVRVNAKTELQGLAVHLRGLLAAEGFSVAQANWYSRADILAGYRYMRLAESLGIAEEITSLNPVTRSTISIQDQFNTANEFHGLDFGAVWRGGWRKWSLELLAKTALGNVHQTVDISGATTISQPNGPTQDYDRGFLALPSNSGQYSRDRFAVIPELGANVGFMVFPRWRASVGYTVIFWGPVVRPGDQIDRDINPDQLPPPITPLAGPLRPAFEYEEVNYWVHGLTLGLEGRW